MEEIYLHNTLTGKKEIFQTQQPNKVHLYSCGPTVYDFAHIGNFRSFLMSDILFRILVYAGYEVIKVQNITDVGHLTNDDLADGSGEDKISKKARIEKKDPFFIARTFEDYFIEDEKILRIHPPQHRPRATDFIEEQIDLINILIEKEYAYERDGSVYFRTHKFKDYGKLSKNNLEDLQAGARVEINETKEDPLDFALWKKAEKNHIMQWASPWGQGFPGWHIECSAMSVKLLNKIVDIHTGGEDNIFPHHECEIAQNECTHNIHIPYWLHAKHLLVDGEKMSKSRGNFYTIRGLVEKGWEGKTIRYALLMGHYRSTINFTEQSLKMAKSSINRIDEALRIAKQYAQGEPKEIREKQLFAQALFDDLNTPQALSVVFDLITKTMKAYEEKTLTPQGAQDLVSFLEEDFNQIFDVLSLEKAIPKDIEDLLEKRRLARESQDWETSDSLRGEIEAMGFEVLDDKGGNQSVREKNSQ